MRLEINEQHGTMEMDTLFFGESEKAYFKTQEIHDVKTIPYPLYKKEVRDLIPKGEFPNFKKAENEIRILSCDIALIGGDANDQSVYTLISAKRAKNGTRYKRDVLNVESHQGLHPKTQALKIRRLFDDFECDYIVLDMLGSGLSVYSYLCKKLYDDERQKEYIAFYSMNDSSNENLSAWHTEDEYEEKIYTVSATEESNSNMAIDLKDKLMNGRISFLIPKSETHELFYKHDWFNKLTPEEQAELMLPYVQMELTGTEMVLLERIDHEKYIKLKEQSGKRKDRYSSLAYGNAFISSLERDLNKTKVSLDDYYIFMSDM